MIFYSSVLNVFWLWCRVTVAVRWCVNRPPRNGGFCRVLSVLDRCPVVLLAGTRTLNIPWLITSKIHFWKNFWLKWKICWIFQGVGHRQSRWSTQKSATFMPGSRKPPGTPHWPAQRPLFEMEFFFQSFQSYVDIFSTVKVNHFVLRLSIVTCSCIFVHRLCVKYEIVRHNVVVSIIHTPTRCGLSPSSFFCHVLARFFHRRPQCLGKSFH